MHIFYSSLSKLNLKYKERNNRIIYQKDPTFRNYLAVKKKKFLGIGRVGSPRCPLTGDVEQVILSFTSKKIPYVSFDCAEGS